MFNVSLGSVEVKEFCEQNHSIFDQHACGGFYKSDL